MLRRFPGDPIWATVFFFFFCGLEDPVWAHGPEKLGFIFLGRPTFSLSEENPSAAATEDAVAQDIHDKEEAGEEAEAEQADTLLDPNAHRQYHPLQRQAPPLAPHQARLLSVL
ncbi:hypothetical protein ACH5RR_014212 [Cinchona calisaya]|uniref:Uncharacterized protein n=1 Tax=Cinchona calisaya TaxID=153742 RepID=A0ABD3A5L7_9GENT